MAVPAFPSEYAIDTVSDDTLEQLRASLSDRYAIEKELGRGGMATVYLATDVRHDRRVAIKVLHPDLGATIGAERFEREIKLAARLQHPHILGLFDSGSANGNLYYVMPFVDGESVRDKLDREKQLSVDEAIQITLEVADALGYAHAQGIIHRDIKPENVMLSNGHALVADFGIARAKTEAGQSKLTQTGMAMGTPVYMSPEQFTGETVTPAADIYSLGCMLYEMLAGDPPFTGKNATAIMAKHAMEAVPSVRIVRPSTPEEVEEAILAAMEKSPADRPRSANEFCEILGTPMGATSTRRVAMRTTAMRRMPTGLHRMPEPVVEVRPWWKNPWVAIGGISTLAGSAFMAWFFLVRGASSADATTVAANAKRVAVRYFTVDGDSAVLQPVADRITESLIRQLQTSRVLTVISANGVAPFRSPDVSADSIARALNVGTIVNGVIEPSGSDSVKITVRLYDEAGGNQGRTIITSVSRGSLFTAEDTVAQNVRAALVTRIGGELAMKEAQSGTRVMTAWTLFNRGERARKDAIAAASAKETDSALVQLAVADSLLVAARAADKAWIEPALQRAQIALDRRRLAKGDAEIDAWLDSARARADEALAIDPGSAKALELRGAVKFAQWQAGERTMKPAPRAALLTEAETDLREAINKDDRLVTAYTTLSALSMAKKDVAAAYLQAKNAYETDEFMTNSASILSTMFYGAYNLQNFEDAQKWCAEGGRRFPGNFNFAMCQLWLQITPDAKADPASAWRLAARVDSLAPENVRAFQSRIAQMLAGGIVGRSAQAMAAGPQREAMLDSARRTLDRAIADRSIDRKQELPGYKAIMLAQMGDLDQAISTLTTYVAANPDHTFRVGGNVHWWWRDLRNKREFQTLLDRTH